MVAAAGAVPGKEDGRRGWDRGGGKGTRGWGRGGSTWARRLVGGRRATIGVEALGEGHGEGGRGVFECVWQNASARCFGLCFGVGWVCFVCRTWDAPCLSVDMTEKNAEATRQ